MILRHASYRASSRISLFRGTFDDLKKYHLCRRRGPRGAGRVQAPAADVYRLDTVSLPKLTPSSIPMPVPASARETSPLVNACASEDWTAPAPPPPPLSRLFLTGGVRRSSFCCSAWGPRFSTAR